MKGKKSRSIQELRLKDVAPDFEVTTTSGVVRLSDYRGRWVLLFAHAADFTPVCTSEIIQLAKMYKRFRNLNCEVISLSLDSTYTHVAWVKSIKEQHGTDVPFPMIGDQGHNVARAYGLLPTDPEKNGTGRSTVLIDNEGHIRLLQHYPLAVGRSVTEILRVLQAAQLADQEGAVLPADWRPGEALMHAPADKLETQASKRHRPFTAGWLSSMRNGLTSRFH